MREFVGIGHAHVRIHFQVQIDVIAKASLARETFLYGQRAGNAHRDSPDFIHLNGIRHHVA
jgi:hypothetical protein